MFAIDTGLFMKLTLFGFRTNMVVISLGYFVKRLNWQSLMIIKIWQTIWL